ncbi:YebG family protein [Parendozoicomonas haliclonae]|uniref:DNA damage-inducible protein YebG n=1 Tax=Parendozoicomonas haliclonae TaxID=1960125 RepID=A0A1X7AR20_9GAMM|nr:YebG family protein [Parendozoicomonas haliclonae]SMA50539.1 DNA damage-inducible protein YebG [Parendozoicomonas haliclonae]
MAVIPMWQCDRDGSMFADKKAAEEHDRMLELAECLTGFLQNHLTLEDDAAEGIGLLLARNKELLAKALKGKPDVLLESQPEAEEA